MAPVATTEGSDFLSWMFSKDGHSTEDEGDHDDDCYSYGDETYDSHGTDGVASIMTKGSMRSFPAMERVAGAKKTKSSRSSSNPGWIDYLRGEYILEEEDDYESVYSDDRTYDSGPAGPEGERDDDTQVTERREEPPPPEEDPAPHRSTTQTWSAPSEEDDFTYGEDHGGDGTATPMTERGDDDDLTIDDGGGDFWAKMKTEKKASDADGHGSGSGGNVGNDGDVINEQRAKISVDTEDASPAVAAAAESGKITNGDGIESVATTSVAKDSSSQSSSQEGFEAEYNPARSFAERHSSGGDGTITGVPPRSSDSAKGGSGDGTESAATASVAEDSSSQSLSQKGFEAEYKPARSSAAAGSIALAGAAAAKSRSSSPLRGPLTKSDTDVHPPAAGNGGEDGGTTVPPSCNKAQASPNTCDASTETRGKSFSQPPAMDKNAVKTPADTEESRDNSRSRPLAATTQEVSSSSAIPFLPWDEKIKAAAEAPASSSAVAPATSAASVSQHSQRTARTVTRSSSSIVKAERERRRKKEVERDRQNSKTIRKSGLKNRGGGGDGGGDQQPKGAEGKGSPQSAAPVALMRSKGPRIRALSKKKQQEGIGGGDDRSRRSAVVLQTDCVRLDEFVYPNGRSSPNNPSRVYVHQGIYDPLCPPWRRSS